MFKSKIKLNHTIDTSTYLIAQEEDFTARNVYAFDVIDVGYNQVAVATSAYGSALSNFSLYNLKLNGALVNVTNVAQLPQLYSQMKIIKYATDKFMLIGRYSADTHIVNLSYNRATNTLDVLDILQLELTTTDFAITQIDSDSFVCAYITATTTSSFSFDIDNDGAITQNATFEITAGSSSNIRMCKIDDTHTAITYTPTTTAKCVLKTLAISATTGAVTQKTTKTIGTQDSNYSDVILLQSDILAFVFGEEDVAGTTGTITIQTYSITPTTYVLTLLDTLSVDDYTGIVFADIESSKLTKTADNRFVYSYSISSSGSATFVVDSDESDVLSKVESYTYPGNYTNMIATLYNSNIYILSRSTSTTDADTLIYHINDGIDNVVISVENGRYTASKNSIIANVSAADAMGSDTITFKTYVTLDMDTYPNDIDWIEINSKTFTADVVTTGRITDGYPIEGVKFEIDYGTDIDNTYTFTGTILTEYGA